MYALGANTLSWDDTKSKTMEGKHGSSLQVGRPPPPTLCARKSSTVCACFAHESASDLLPATSGICCSRPYSTRRHSCSTLHNGTRRCTTRYPPGHSTGRPSSQHAYAAHSCARMCNLCAATVVRADGSVLLRQCTHAAVCARELPCEQAPSKPSVFHSLRSA